MQPVTYRFSKSPPLLDVLSLASLAMFIFPLLMAAGIGLRWLEVPGTEWIKTLGPEDIIYFWMFLGLAAILGVFFVITLAWKSPTRNFVRLDDVGLTYVFMGLRRRWPWRTTDWAEVEQTGLPIRVAKLAISGTFGWIDRLALLFLNTLASSSQATLRLPDFYDVPIEQIVASINEHRSAALGEKRAAATAQPTRESMGNASAEPLVFGKSTVMYRRLRMVQNALLALTFPLIAVAAFTINQFGDVERAKVWPAGAILIGLTIAMMAIVMIMQRRVSLPRYNHLSLDAGGLSYMRFGKSQRWTWDDVSLFKLEIATSKRLLGRRRFITFSAPGSDWTWRWLRRYYGLRSRPPLVLIEDVYESPLDEIARTLNAWREHAVDGGTTPVGSGTAFE